VSARRPARRASPALWAVALVVIASQAGAWLHAAATPHVTCVEHGESVHLDVRSGAPDVQAGGAAQLADALDAAPSAPAAHAHDHCRVQASRVFASAAPARTVAALPAPLPKLPATAVPRSPLQLLFLAPKTSPPRPPVV